MAKHSFGEIHLDVETGRQGAAVEREPDSPFRVAILGDFSGRASRGIRETGAKLASRRVISIDRDNFDEVLARLAPQLRLPLGGEGEVAVAFKEIEDFRPEGLFESVEVFHKLRDMRARLADSRTFAEAAAEGLGAGAGPAAEAVPPVEAPNAPTASAGGSLLDQIVVGSGSRPLAAPVRRPDELRAYLRQLVEPHLAPGADPRQPELLAKVDAASGDALRKLLHHPAFQALEAAWRAALFLVRRVETDANLKLYLVDVTKAELAADLASAEDLRQTGVYKLLVEKSVETPGAEAWSVLAGNFTFEPTRDDALLLARLATIARAAGAPFIGGAGAPVLGFASFGDLPDVRKWAGPADAEAWRAFRALPQAAHVGLAMPRYLLRLPYGRQTDPIERFDFEEMPGAEEHVGQTSRSVRSVESAHETYLWGNSAFLCALLLAQSFSEAGWAMRPGMHQDVDGLPLHVFKRDGESVAKPCAEALLTEPAIERMLELGVMPLVSPVGRDAVRLVRFQSLADPPAPLAGPWSAAEN
ncbi:MAG: type VI secretion system contractile sheath domain-containing protein [Candidatus Acidiferrales bacterium]